MHKIVRFVLLPITLIVIVASVVFAQASLPVVDGGQTVSTLVGAFESKHWSLVVAAVLMLAVWGAGQFGLLSKLPSKAIPWVASAAGVVAAGASAVIGGQSLSAALEAAVHAGFMAVGAWETVGQHLLAAPVTAPKV